MLQESGQTLNDFSIWSGELWEHLPHVIEQVEVPTNIFGT